MKRMSRIGFVASIIVSAVVLTGVSPSSHAADAFSTAKQKYDSKDYQGALNDFKALAAKYPTNGLCHYYLALCNQCLSRTAEAKREYQWVIANDRTSLKQKAEVGFNQLNGVNTGSGSGSSSSGAASSSSASSSSVASNTGAKAGRGAVKTVMDFYTTWCGPCKAMEPGFEAAKRKYSAIAFKRFDAEAPENKAMVQQYAVHAYPTIVMLDAGGKVLFNQAGALIDEELGQTIDEVNGR
jgi:thiol-disulfide isomerase/thioredoxin